MTERTKQTIALVDDDRNILTSVQMTLEAEGFNVRTYTDGEAALQGLTAYPVDLAVLDIKMPRMDGMELLQRLRSRSNLPVIFLSSKNEEVDQLMGLRLGADDYITTPFSPAELIARVDALIRRLGVDEAEKDSVEVHSGPFLLNSRNRTLEKNGTRLKLTQIEYLLVKLFMENPGRAMSREEILKAVWGADFDGELKTVDVNIRRLRMKIEDDPTEPEYLTTVWGYGYKWGY